MLDATLIDASTDRVEARGYRYVQLDEANWPLYAERILAVEHASYEPSRRGDRKFFDAIVRHPGGASFMFLREEEVAGFCFGAALEAFESTQGARTDPQWGKGTTFYSADLTVASSHRHRGLGHALKAIQIRSARELGYRYVVGRNRVGLGDAVLRINVGFGARRIQFFDKGYADDLEPAGAVYYQIDLEQVQDGLALETEKLGRLWIDNRLYEDNWQRGCNLPACGSACCRTGVSLTEAEIDRIRPHQSSVEALVGEPLERCFKRDIVVSHLNMDYAKQWRRTEEREGHCIFFKDGVGCVLQHVATGKGLHKWAIKPLYCVAYPLHWQDYTLMMSPSYAGAKKGVIDCRLAENAVASTIVWCREEIEWLCGRDNYKEILERGRRLGHRLDGEPGQPERLAVLDISKTRD